MVADTSTLYRVTSPTLASCMGDTVRVIGVPDSCVPEDTRSPLNTVATATSADTGQVRADPALVEDGHVTVVAIDPETGATQSTTRVRATPDTDLGGALPGLILPAGTSSRASGAPSMPAGTQHLVVFPNFNDLTARAQAQFRGLVARTAPTALFMADDDAELVAERHLAQRSAVLGGVAVTVLCLVGGTVATAARAPQRRRLLVAGADAGRLRGLAVAATAAVVAPGLGGALIGRSVAWVVGIHDGSGFGWVWLVPVAFLLSGAGFVVARGLAAVHRDTMVVQGGGPC